MFLASFVTNFLSYKYFFSLIFNSFKARLMPLALKEYANRVSICGQQTPTRNEEFKHFEVIGRPPGLLVVTPPLFSNQCLPEHAPGRDKEKQREHPKTSEVLRIRPQKIYCIYIMNSRGRLACYAKREAVSITELKVTKSERNAKATVEIVGSKRGACGN